MSFSSIYLIFLLSETNNSPTLISIVRYLLTFAYKNKTVGMLILVLERIIEK